MRAGVAALLGLPAHSIVRARRREPLPLSGGIIAGRPGRAAY
jgi:hypothetical protein